MEWKIKETMKKTALFAENTWCTICNYKYAKLDEKGKKSMERYRGPAGIRLSVQGPGCRERDEVSARAAGGVFQSVDVRAARLKNL